MKRPVTRESYGWRLPRLRIIRDNDESFRDLVAQQCYGLTHELVLRSLGASARDTRFTGNTDAAWMELDRAMLEFTTSQRRKHERRTYRAILGSMGIRRRR